MRTFVSTSTHELLLQKAAVALRSDLAFIVDFESETADSCLCYERFNDSYYPSQKDVAAFTPPFLRNLLLQAGEVALRGRDLALLANEPAGTPIHFWYGQMLPNASAPSAICFVFRGTDRPDIERTLAIARAMLSLYQAQLPNADGPNDGNQPFQNSATLEMLEMYKQMAIDMADNIRYAARIQRVIFQQYQSVFQKFGAHYMFNRPQNLLSGDFYWARSTDTEIMLVFGDCTGHGVPGAMLTLLGINLLNQIYFESGMMEPGRLLQLLNLRLVGLLQPEGNASAINDGMEAVAFTFNCKTREVKYACANLGFVVIQDGVSIRIRNNRHVVGGVALGEDGIEDPMFRIYAQDSFVMSEGNRVIVYSDGISDQFSDRVNRSVKFGHKPTIEIFNSPMPLQLCGEAFEKQLADWMAGTEQLDDMLLMALEC